MMPELERIQKLLAKLGFGSRRQIEAWISEGRIELNGRIAKLGDKATAHDKLKLDGKALTLHADKQDMRMLLYNKPEGEMCTRHDPNHRPTVFANLPALSTGRWVMVGRLDINSSGLLLFTNEGELAHQLMHPSFGIEREYTVRVLGQVSDAILKNLLQGVKVDGEFLKFKSIAFSGGKGANSWYKVILCEGKQREVRRLFESQGLKVSRLIRIRYGTVKLPRTLKMGEYTELDAAQITRLQTLL